MKSEKRKRLTGVLPSSTAHWKAKIAIVLAITVSAANITPAAVLGEPSHKKKALKVTFQSGENGYFAGLDEGSSSTKSNASKSNTDRKKWVQSFYNLEEDDQGYFTNLALGAEEVEAKNQKPIWETITNQVNENSRDEDELVFAGWYAYDGEIPMLVSDYKEIYSNTTLEAEWYDPKQIEGEAKDIYDVVAVGLNKRKLMVFEPEIKRDIEEVEQWAKAALLKEELKLDGEDVLALELEITGDESAEKGKEKEIVVTLSVDKEKLDLTKQISVIYENKDGKAEIIPADVVKANHGDGYQVTFTMEGDGEYYLVNTTVYRKPLMSAPARVNSSTKTDENKTREAVTSGKIGENLNWKIEDAVLTISGMGDMPDWESDEDCPWYGNIRKEVEEIIIGEGIIRIGKNAFYGFSSVTNVQIPQGVTSIGERAFSYNTSLTEMDIPDGVVSIDGQAFAFDKKLSRIIIPNSVVEIKAHAFYKCTALTDVDIPDSVVTINMTAFSMCDNLPETTVVGKGNLGDSLTWKITKKGELTISGQGEMPDNARPWSSASQDIISVEIQEGVTSIGDFAFYGCNKFTSVKIAEGVIRIGQGAFSNCTSLESIEIPKSVISIGSYVFNECGNLVNVKILEGVTEIGQGAFSKCTNLESIEIPKSVTEIDKDVFSECTSLNNVIMTGNILQIGESAFLGCSKLVNITIPEGVCRIERFAFFDTGIDSVTIPKSVIFLGQKSFPKGTQIISKKMEDSISESLKLTGNINFVNADNEHEQNYSTYASSVINSYLYEGDNETFYRVQSTYNQTVIEQYRSDNTFVKSWNVPMELPKFGGFYEGSDALYIVFGQDNVAEDDDVEVIRVVKYSKNMERLSDVKIYGANTETPFRSSCLRMDEKDNYLYIHTGHRMYKSPDGLNHQANVTIVIDTECMILSSCQVEVSNISTGYVSHSFNQFVKTDEDMLIMVDQGDAYPREIVMVICPDDDVLDNPKSITLLTIPGETGENYTGVSIGGLEVSNSSYLVAGNTIDQDHFDSSVTRNIFISVVDKNNPDGNSNYIQVTDYAEGGDYSASTPQLVKISEDLFAVMWEEILSSSNWWDIDTNGMVKIAFFDGEGNQLGNIEEFEGSLSDCQPTIIHGNVKWYVSNGSNLTFYTFPANEPDSSTGIKVSKNVLTMLERSLTALTAEPDKITQNSITLNAVTISPAESTTDGTLEYGFALENDSSKVRNWQSGTEFSGLRSNTTYYFFARISGGMWYKDVISDSLQLTTKSDDIGGSGDSGNTGGSGNTGNTGGSGNTGNTGGSGNSSGGSSGSGGSSSGGSSGSGGSSSGGSGSSGGSHSGGGSGGGGGSRSVGGSSSSGGPGASLPSYVEKGEWAILNGFWHFVDASGNAKVNTWTAAYNPYATAGQQNYDWFRFDANGNMLTGWFTDVDGNRYFLNPVSDGTLGKMLTGWVWIADEFGVQRCYYFNPNSDGYRGKLLTNTVVDGYTIDASGCWTVDGVIQVK